MTNDIFYAQREMLSTVFRTTMLMDTTNISPEKQDELAIQNAHLNVNASEKITIGDTHTNAYKPILTTSQHEGNRAKVSLLRRLLNLLKFS